MYAASLSFSLCGEKVGEMDVLIVGVMWFFPFLSDRGLGSWSYDF